MKAVALLLALSWLSPDQGSTLVAAMANRTDLLKSGGSTGLCPEGFHDGCDNRCYNLGREKRNFDDARAACRAMNADLAMIRNNDEQVRVTRYTTTEWPSGEQWDWVSFGLRKASEHASWAWVHDGFVSSYFNWDAPDGQPDNVVTELCVVLSPTGGVWHTQNCNVVHRYLCEAERLPAQSPLPTTTPPPTTCPTASPCPSCPTAPSCDFPIASPHTPPPLIARCSKGVLTIPTVDLETVESTTAKFIGDNSFKCRLFANHLHSWVVGLISPNKAVSQRLESDTVAVQCRGKGVLELSNTDVNAAEAINITVDIAATKKCLELFHNFWREILKLR